MTGRTHLITGAAGGCAAVAVCASVPLWTRMGAFVLVLLGSLAPDIDHEGATRSSTRLVTSALAALVALPLLLWPPVYRLVRALLTRALLVVVEPLAIGAHRLAVWGGRALFTATATRYDVDDWNDGHRLVTHTALGAGTAGMAVSAGTAGIGFGVTALSPGIGAGIVAAWWVWGLAFAWGCLVHILILGDICTVQGAPILWPLKIHGKRWWMVRAPVTVHTGGDGERYGVVPVAWGLVVIAAFWMVGLWGPIFSMLGWLAGRP